jgi:hypothetical protein
MILKLMNYCKADEIINEELAKKIEEAGIEAVEVVLH